MGRWWLSGTPAPITGAQGWRFRGSCLEVLPAGTGCAGCVLWAARRTEGTLASHTLCLSLPLLSLAGHCKRGSHTHPLPSLAQLLLPESLLTSKHAGTALFLLRLVSLTSSHLDQFPLHEGLRFSPGQKPPVPSAVSLLSRVSTSLVDLVTGHICFFQDALTTLSPTPKSLLGAPSVPLTAGTVLPRSSAWLFASLSQAVTPTDRSSIQLHGTQVPVLFTF